jgi:hypothetical protein
VAYPVSLDRIASCLRAFTSATPAYTFWSYFSSADERKVYTSDTWRVRVAPAHDEPRSGQNNNERESTSGRSTDYGSAHLIRAFRDIGRTFSLLFLLTVARWSPAERKSSNRKMEYGFVEGKNGFIRVSCGTSKRGEQNRGRLGSLWRQYQEICSGGSRAEMGVEEKSIGRAPLPELPPVTGICRQLGLNCRDILVFVQDVASRCAAGENVAWGCSRSSLASTDMARCSTPGSAFVVRHCTISMKAQVWRRPSSRESITLAHSPPGRRSRLVPVYLRLFDRKLTLQGARMIWCGLIVQSGSSASGARTT